MAHVFLSYVRDDQQLVDRLADELRQAGVSVWLDRDQIKPGQRWQHTIRQAIENGAYFIACFSRQYEMRSRSYMNEELTLAIEELRRRPVDRTWFIPILLTDASIPDRPIGAGETLRDIQWVSLYEDWDDGIRRILDVVAPIGPPSTRLTDDERRVLSSLTQHPMFPLRSKSGISRDTRLDPVHVKRALTKLVEAGIAAETSGKKGVRWSITPKGKTLLERD